MTTADSLRHPTESVSLSPDQIRSNGAVWRATRGPFRALRGLLDLFSSIWLGITLLTLLFIYCSIGSSGLPMRLNIYRPETWVAVRELPGLEMTEFEWFHWWPFDLLIALICINLVTATLRRIRFNAVNLGVWMIHSGIIILAIGSVVYFSTKLEGQAPVVRRTVKIEAPGHDPVYLAAIPGNGIVVGEGANQKVFEISRIDPDWEILAERDKGKRAYSVNVRVLTPNTQFTRQLLDGYPQYTEDIVASADPNQPFARAKKTLGRALVDDSITMSLEYAPQEFFYLVQSAAIYLRERGSREWIERPIRNLPRYNDYLASADDVWLQTGDPASELEPPRPIDIVVPAADPNDPLKNMPLHITGYLRYAALETRQTEGGNALNPAIRVSLGNISSGQVKEYDLAALDPARSSAEAGRLVFHWLSSPTQLDALTEREPMTLTIRVPAAGVTIEKTIEERPDPNAEFTPIEGTDFAWRLIGLEGIQLEEPVSIAIVEFRTPERTFQRWVTDPPRYTRDLATEAQDPMHAGALEKDERIEATFDPGRQPPTVILAAGPGENDLQVVATTREGRKRASLAVGEPVALSSDIQLTVTQYAARTMPVTRPVIVPKSQREKSVENRMSKLQVRVGRPDGEPTWLAYHEYPFQSRQHVLRGFPYQPAVLRIGDAEYEVMYSRERQRLPAPVVLQDFELTPQVGGYTGSTLSVRDWTSHVRFASESGGESESGGGGGGESGGEWSDLLSVRVNDPAEFGGFWYFQAMWDAPQPARFDGDVPSAGLNFTVLGVGNRQGVHVQLAGCCLAVIGMMYAFYVKPIIKRRRQQRVLAELASAGEAREMRRDARAPAPGRAMAMEPRS